MPITRGLGKLPVDSGGNLTLVPIDQELGYLAMEHAIGAELTSAEKARLVELFRAHGYPVPDALQPSH
jgi:hypothetical protein